VYDKSPRKTIEYHRSMLADRRRTEAFERAIERTVKPGDRVLDLGCGTGILSLFARRAGAAKVYAVEMGSVIELARAVHAANPLPGEVVFHHQLSHRVELPERVDVVVTETLGNFGLDEGILGTVLDARKRFLEPGGTIVPRALELFLAPVEAPELHRQLDLWTADPYGFDYTPVRPFAVHNPDWVKLDPRSLLAPPASLARLELAEVDSDEVRAEAAFTVERGGRCHGFGGWFGAELAEGITLSNAPPLRTPSWRHAFLPFERPLELRAGDQLHAQVDATADGAIWRWRLHHHRPGLHRPLATLDQSSFAGTLLSPTELRKRAAHHTPTLTEDGEVDLLILRAMDGRRPLHEIARRVAERYPDRFPTEAQALERVRELSQRYGR